MQGVVSSVTTIDGEMKLQFFHVRDLCGLMEMIMKEKPADHVFNVENVS